jgi:hypothetical protein
MIYHIYNPKVGKMGPVLTQKEIEDNPPTLLECRQISADLGQDLNVISNAKLVIKYLCDRVEELENENN